jgi:hypothetical protein
MSDVERALDAALAGLSDKAKLRVLEAKRYEVAQRLQINESKLTNGTSGERVACEQLGLEWNAEGVNGCDAWDSESRGVELKCFKSSATRANVNYVFPVRKKAEQHTQYVERVCEHYRRSCAGGHYWVLLTHGSTQYKQHWYLEAEAFAAALRELMLREPGKTKMNFGAAYCKDCGIPHRIDEISKALRKHAVFPEKVKGRCYKKKTPVK